MDDKPNNPQQNHEDYLRAIQAMQYMASPTFGSHAEGSLVGSREQPLADLPESKSDKKADDKPKKSRLEEILERAVEKVIVGVVQAIEQTAQPPTKESDVDVHGLRRDLGNNGVVSSDPAYPGVGTSGQGVQVQGAATVPVRTEKPETVVFNEPTPVHPEPTEPPAMESPVPATATEVPEAVTFAQQASTEAATSTTPQRATGERLTPVPEAQAYSPPQAQEPPETPSVRPAEVIEPVAVDAVFSESVTEIPEPAQVRQSALPPVQNAPVAEQVKVDVPPPIQAPRARAVDVPPVMKRQQEYTHDEPVRPEFLTREQVPERPKSIGSQVKPPPRIEYPVEAPSQEPRKTTDNALPQWHIPSTEDEPGYSPFGSPNVEEMNAREDLGHGADVVSDYAATQEMFMGAMFSQIQVLTEKTKQLMIALERMSEDVDQ